MEASRSRPRHPRSQPQPKPLQTLNYPNQATPPLLQVYSSTKHAARLETLELGELLARTTAPDPSISPTPNTATPRGGCNAYPMPSPEYQRAWKAANPHKSKQYRDAARQRGSDAPRPHCACGAVVPTHRSEYCRNCRSFVGQVSQRTLGPCSKCGAALTITARVCLPCKRATEAARYRARDGRRRAAKRMTNLTPADIRIQMQRTYCPLCRKRMTDEPDLPLTKHHEHIIPINMGGTHTWENTRVTCRTCNLKRPKDGSDVTGQVALWQAEPAFAPKQRTPKVVAHKPPPQRMHCMPPAPCACGCGKPTRYGKRYAGRGRHLELRGSKYDHLYPLVTSLLAQGHRSKRIASTLGVNRDTAREIMERIERISEREMSHA